MKITTQQELDDLIATADKSNTIVLDENLEITFNCVIRCNITAHDIDAHDITAYNINAHNIDAGDINAHDINAWNINAGDINAHDINAHDIDAGDINAHDINAWNINAGDINAHDINAKNIEYYAFCIAYQSLKCESIAGERENSFHKCLDREIEIVKEEEKKATIELTQSQLDKIKHLI